MTGAAEIEVKPSGVVRVLAKTTAGSHHPQSPIAEMDQRHESETAAAGLRSAGSRQRG